VLETIDMSEIPTLKEPGTKAEKIYFEKVVQAVDQANRFANIHSTNFYKKVLFFVYKLHRFSSRLYKIINICHQTG
jgi:hypothetical protein